MSWEQNLAGDPYGMHLRSSDQRSGNWVEKNLDALYEQAEAEGAVPWTDAGGWNEYQQLDLDLASICKHYPEEGEPSKQERDEFEETFPEE